MLSILFANASHKARNNNGKTKIQNCINLQHASQCLLAQKVASFKAEFNSCK
jgi:hypothetical protein